MQGVKREEKVKKIKDKSIWNMSEEEFAKMTENADYRLSIGQATINEIRKEMGMDEINDPAFDKCYAIVKQEPKFDRNALKKMIKERGYKQKVIAEKAGIKESKCRLFFQEKENVVWKIM